MGPEDIVYQFFDHVYLVEDVVVVGGKTLDHCGLTSHPLESQGVPSELVAPRVVDSTKTTASTTSTTIA